MPIRIPPTHKEAFEIFAGLSEDKSEALLRALKNTTPAITAAALAQRVASQVELSFREVQAVVAVAGSLFVIREQRDLPLSKFIEEVVEAAQRDKILDKSDKLTVETLQNRLLSYLSLENPLGISAKATTLLARHQNFLRSAKIYTDVRPVFLGENPPEVAVVIHMLEIDSITNGKRVSNYFALDSSELKQLTRVIQSAIKKENAIRERLNNISILEPEIDQ